jgi:hypothetical protein
MKSVAPLSVKKEHRRKEGDRNRPFCVRYTGVIMSPWNSIPPILSKKIFQALPILRNYQQVRSPCCTVNVCLCGTPAGPTNNHKPAILPY